MDHDDGAEPLDLSPEGVKTRITKLFPVDVRANFEPLETEFVHAVVQLGNGCISILERDGAEGGEPTWKTRRILSEFVVDHSSDPSADLRVCPVVVLVNRNRHGLDINAHGIHILEPLLEKIHLGPEKLQLPAIDFTCELTAVLEANSTRFLFFSLHDLSGRAALTVTVNVNDRTVRTRSSHRFFQIVLIDYLQNNYALPKVPEGVQVQYLGTDCIIYDSHSRASARGEFPGEEPMSDNIPDCLPPDRHPHPGSFAMPARAIDTHVHVFDSRYPVTPDRGYNPPDSTLADLLHLHTTLGIERVVFTQPSVYGADNSAILDGMNALNAQSPNRARAIIATGLGVTDAELADWDSMGVRGVRLNTDNKGGMPLELGQIPELCERIAPLGWHIEFLFPGKDLVELLPIFESLTVPMSIGHFAYQAAVDGVAAPGFQALLGLMRRGNTWMKISGANRVSETDLPPYDDVAPMAHALIEAAPERIMWGTDWPHPNKYEVNPNDGDLLDGFGEWVNDEAMRKKIMVDTPATFYRF